MLAVDVGKAKVVFIYSVTPAGLRGFHLYDPGGVRVSKRWLLPSLPRTCGKSMNERGNYRLVPPLWWSQ